MLWWLMVLTTNGGYINGELIVSGILLIMPVKGEGEKHVFLI